MKILTSKQEKFCVNYFTTGNATQSAIEAGYSAKTATVIASSNLKKPNLAERIKELRDRAVSDKIMSVIERKERLTEIAKEEILNNQGIPMRQSNIFAIAELNKMEGVYAPTKTDITSGGKRILPTPVFQIVNIETKDLLARVQNGERTELLEADINLQTEQRSVADPQDKAVS